MTDETDLEEPMSGVLEFFPEHARLIGCFTAQWTHIEYNLIMLLAFTVGSPIDIVLPMLYSIQSSSSRLSAVEAALLKLLSEERERADTVQGVCDRARQILTLRDKFAHALYGWHEATGPAGRLSIIGVGKRKGHAVEIHELKDHFKRAKQLNQDIASLISFELTRREMRRAREQARVLPFHPPGSTDDHTDPSPQAPLPPSPESQGG